MAQVNPGQLLLTTTVADISGTQLAFTFVVPGHQAWTLRSVRAVAGRNVGGAPNRDYVLVITDGTNVVAALAAGDAGTEPGVCSVTWANCPAATSASGSDGVVVAPLGPLLLPAGYQIIGTIQAPAVGDTWVTALVWYDYADVS